MKKISNYLVVILFFLCFIPCVAKASSLGTLGPGATASGSYAWWDEGSCVASTSGPFTFTARKSYYKEKDSYYRFLDVKINDYVDKNYNNMKVTCTVRDDRNHPITSGRVYSWTTYEFTFNITAGGSIPVNNNQSYSLAKGDTINLFQELGVKTIKSFEHSVGRELNTIGYSGCYSGASSCIIDFDSGSPLQDREHRFTMVYDGTNGTTYRAVVTVYELEEQTHYSLGNIVAGSYATGSYITGSSGMSCSLTNTTIPATVTVETSGTKQRIKVSNTNNTLSAYNGHDAKCTFKKNGKSHTYFYSFNLNERIPVEESKSYDVYPGDVIDIAKDLNLKKIVESNLEYRATLFVYSGCNSSDTTCKLTVGDDVIEGKTSTSTILYYDKSNVLKRVTINFTERDNTVTDNLGTISINNTVSGFIDASNVSCVADASKPYEAKLVKISNNQYRVDIKNINKTVKVHNTSYTCTGKPAGVGSREFNYIFNFTLSAETVPVKETKEYELFPGESLNFTALYAIRNITKWNYAKGSNVHSMSLFGCAVNDYDCVLTFSGSVLHNREHKIIITYVNTLDILYETTVIIAEKDPNMTTKAYPGLMGFCEFDSNWEYTQWADSSGKIYSFYETLIKGSKLPDCKESAQNGKLFEFKGWTKGYKAGDVLTTKTTCNSVVPAGSKVNMGEVYAPCYEMVPHVRLASNGGLVEIKSPWEFIPSDMVYMATGSSYTATVKLPDVEYTGFHANSKLRNWRNSDTGELKKAGDSVPLDGSVWVALSDNVVTQIDLYKNIEVGATEKFKVEGMKSCSIVGGYSTYLTLSYSSGSCTVTGVTATPYQNYVEVLVKMNNGEADRTYKFTVEDRTGADQNGNGIFVVDTSKNQVAGENDDAVTDGIYTNQCNAFKVSNANYKNSKVGFATSKKTGEILYSGAYSVRVDTSKCSTDTNKYVAFCLDPGRRGPGELGTGEVDYIRTTDINLETDFGKLVAYIVQNKPIKNFGTYGTNDKERVASHVALRVSAIKNGMSTAVDPADLVYSTHYYPYAAVAEKLGRVDDDGDITESEALAALNYETVSGDKPPAGNGMNWSGYTGYRDEIAEILSAYDGSTGTAVSKGDFERTIDKVTLDYPKASANDEGYTITYEGTLTLPAGTTSASLTKCSDSNGFNVKCEVVTSGGKSLTSTGTYASGNRPIYRYKVKIIAAKAKNVKVPQTESDEKKLAFELTYNGASLVQAAFIANPSNGSDNLQRMLILSTTTPKAFVYWDVVPNDCKMPSLAKENCKDEAHCASFFNKDLFVAAGCCRYLLDTTTYKYLNDNFCEAKCTSSTLTSACAYNTDTTKKSDLYKIREGEQIKTGGTNVTYEPNVGACVAEVSTKYVNDNAQSLENISNTNKFTKYDDAKNLINVDAYKNNRYCQVTCKEDWDLSMESFGNFVGTKAVAAGTYFQIIESDMFMSGTRTCYTTFINYDRFMNNIVDLSNELVDNYNWYSEWSHVWTDIDRQEEAGYSTASKITNHSDAPICVEFADKCPSFHTAYQNTNENTGTYFWAASHVDSGNKGGCLQVPQYGNSGAIKDASCKTSRANETTYNSNYGNSDDHSDSDMTFKNGGKNDINERCTFTRTYCPGNDEPYGEQSLVQNNKKCEYWDYETRKTKAKVWTYKDRSTKSCTPKYDKDGNETGCTCGSSYSKSGDTCYKKCSSPWSTASLYECKKKICPDDTTEVDGVCYVDGASGCKSGYSQYSGSGSSKYCRKLAYVSSKTKTFTYEPKYKETYLRCKVWGKAVDYTLITKNDVEVNNAEGYDVYYETYEKTPVSLVNSGMSGANKKSDTNTENYTYKEGTKKAKSNYSKTYTHQCTVKQGKYEPDGAVGTSSCAQESYIGGYGGSDPSTNKMFCKKYAPTSDRKEAFCYVSDASTSNEKDATYTNTANTYTNDSYHSDEKSAFTFMTEFMKRQAKIKSDSYKSAMSSKHSSIYSHAYDIFDCQHFQLHNNSDDMDSSRKNNNVGSDTIMGMSRSYVKLLTEFNPSATYQYDEDAFMTILGEDNVLEQFTEKNDTLYGGNGKYASSTNTRVEVNVKTGGTGTKTYLYRNYLESHYYNPADVWVNDTDQSKYYHDTRNNYDVTTKFLANDADLRSSKQIVMCSVGTKTNGTGVYDGKDGAVVAFSLPSSEPEWIGGRCYQVKVDYKKVHYAKTSISNSSFYKNKGYWYLRGGDIKEHGNDLKSALSNANNRAGSSVNYNYSNEKTRWSRLGSFNAFPISMGTPRNLYQYTYTFGQIGSYYNGKLGRIMGTTKSIIQDNTRSCFYEVYEEVCLCCGYKMKPGDLVENYVNTTPGYNYKFSDVNDMGDNTNGTLSIYTNSVSLGNLSQGRTDVADNWSSNQKFMYNGTVFTTDKGQKLKNLIEDRGEAIYAEEPEYAYYLTPDMLKAIRTYNDAIGYELNYNNLIVYEANLIGCTTATCSDTSPKIEDTINFQHYGSKFLVGKSTLKKVDISKAAYGSIKNNYDQVCEVKPGDVDDIPGLMKNDAKKCRWVDYVQARTYTDPATGKSYQAFRLAFK